ncbi:mitoguardin 1 [Crotalus tigris]|uniref:mitoguardin 1 n=1 Tax=Crotalus tigris TaxID=88082 RepID=UPI00192F54D2|nr:mitoguardin 1 [Crotalus tigris]XP_039212604.1 mitoguardin 1 [Crotalus tigris]
MSEDAANETRLPLKTTALRVFDLPLSWYNSLIQVKISPGLKKLFAITAVSAITVLFLAHHFKRKRGKKTRKISPWESDHLMFDYAKTSGSEKNSSCCSSRQNLTLSLNSIKEKDFQSYIHASGDLFNKYSGSVQSLASAHSATSCPSCVCVNSNSWNKADEDNMKLVNIPVTTPENLYLMGMELFEEALQRWEQALTFRNRQVEDEASCGAIKIGAGDAIAEEHIEDIISAEFIHKLELLLQRAYRLQEEFEASLGASDPASFANEAGNQMDNTMKDITDEFSLRDTISIGSTDSFVSAAELTEHKESRNYYHLDSLCHCPLYEEALHMAEEGKIYSRVLRTEMLECLGDSDFLAKLHCIRQAFQVILSDSANRIFLAESGRRILCALILRARKNPKKFEEVFDEMISFLEQADQWIHTEMELAAYGVKHLNFYDVVLDFILMDSFEDLENPPMSIQNIVNNHWLNSSFKETAVASSCWSVLKQKKQQMKVPDGFFAHFYAVCEHISPVLAWGFLGPRNSLNELCSYFKNQILYFLKDIFDFEKVRYSSVDNLAEDLLQLLIRHTNILLVYFGVSGCQHPTASDLSEAKVQ